MSAASLGPQFGLRGMRVGMLADYFDNFDDFDDFDTFRCDAPHRQALATSMGGGQRTDAVLN